MPVIPELGNRRRKDPCGSSASLSKLSRSCKLGKRPCLSDNVKVTGGDTWHQSLASTCVSTHRHTWTRLHIDHMCTHREFSSSSSFYIWVRCWETFWCLLPWRKWVADWEWSSLSCRAKLHFPFSIYFLLVDEMGLSRLPFLLPPCPSPYLVSCSY